MKELNKGTVISILLHGIMLGGFLWMTRDAELTTAMGGEDAPAGSVQFASNSAASKPIDVSDLVVPPQSPPEEPEPQPEEKTPEMPPELPDTPTPVATVEPAVKEALNGEPILEKKEPVKPKQKAAAKKPKAPKKPVTEATASVPHQMTRAERIIAMRKNLNTSSAKRGNFKLIAARNAAAGGGMPSTDAGTIGAGLSKGVGNETLKLGGIGVGGTGLGGKGGGDTDGTGTPDGDRYAGALQGALHRAWQQPSGNEVSGKPTVDVKFTIQSNGVIASKGVVRGSRSSAMDASINAMLRKLTRVPAPANYGVKASSVTIVVTFELD